MPLFTIMMCTYNSSETLRTAVASVLKQKFTEWEMIILDNGSSDNTVQLLKDYQEKDKRIRCIYGEENIGWCKGISVCLKETHGTYMMFLGADDYLASENTLQEVAAEIREHMPEVVWTGCGYAVYENGTYQVMYKIEPEHKIYASQDKLTQFYEIMKNVRYNSVMHYVKVDFLKKIGVDFYSPFYGDCEGMTEVIAKAKKMVVMDKVEYILTLNTSQTVKKTGYYFDAEQQWKSVKSCVPMNRKNGEIAFVAWRILANLSARCQSIALGEPIRDREMQDIQKDLAERFLRVEEIISSEGMGEMLCYAGREKWAEELLGAAGINYWVCKKNEELLKKINGGSKWLAEFVEFAMEADSSGQIEWKKYISVREKATLERLLANESNSYKLGLELLLKEDIVYEDVSMKEIIKEYLQESRIESYEAADSLRIMMEQEGCGKEKRLIEIFKEIETIWLQEATGVTEDVDEYFRKMQKELMTAEEGTRKDFVQSLENILNRQVCVLRKIYINSFLLNITGDTTYVKDIISLTKENRQFSAETKYFLYNQLKSNSFLNVYKKDSDSAKELYFFLKDIVAEYKEKLEQKFAYIPEKDRNKDFVLVITEQFLDIEHGPTKSAMGRCVALQKMGKNVFLLNTAEQMSQVGEIPFFDVHKGNYFSENSTLDKVVWKSQEIPFYQCENNMPNRKMIEYLLKTVSELKPYYVVAIGGDGIVASLVNDIVPVLSVGMVFSALGACVTSYQTLGRQLNDTDKKYLESVGKAETQIIEHKFTSDVVEQVGVVRREDLEIPREDFVLLVTGSRLLEEVTDEFLEMLKRVINGKNMTVMLLGDFGREDRIKKARGLLGNKVCITGHQKDVMAYVELADLYVNPFREGGGMSCVEAMSKGLPVVTINYGDVSVNAGEAFVTENYETMGNLIAKYQEDKAFYHLQSIKAKDRAKFLVNTEQDFKDVIREFSKREGLLFE